MGFKDFFIESDNTEQKPKATVKPSKEVKFPDEVTSSNSFPSSNSTFTPTPSGVSQELLVKFTDMYQKGFDSLNQAGYDFYEYFKAVMKGGVDNPAIYDMALGMAAAMDSSVTKEKLLSTADFYMSEILKVYQNQVNSANAKKTALASQRDLENQSLTSELGSLEQQLATIQMQIQDRKTKLSLIGDKYQPQVVDLDAKLMANDFAKNKIVTDIQKVKDGINNNIK